MAIEYHCLLNALLSIAALHLSKLYPREARFTKAHQQYFDAAIVDQRNALSNMNSSNADALCIAAALIGAQALTVPSQWRNEAFDTTWLDMAAGVTTVVEIAMQWIRDSGRLMPLVEVEPTIYSQREKALEPEYRQQFAPLLEHNSVTETVEPDLLSAYEFLLGYIGVVLAAYDSGEDPSKVRRRISGFGSSAPLPFRNALHDHRPLALLVLAHHFAVMKAVDDVWWLRGVPEREIFRIQSVLPEDWQWAMSWPLQKLSTYAAASIKTGPPASEHSG